MERYPVIHITREFNKESKQKEITRVSFAVGSKRKYLKKVDGFLTMKGNDAYSLNAAGTYVIFAPAIKKVVQRILHHTRM